MSLLTTHQVTTVRVNILAQPIAMGASKNCAGVLNRNTCFGESSSKIPDRRPRQRASGRRGRRTAASLRGGADLGGAGRLRLRFSGSRRRRSLCRDRFSGRRQLLPSVYLVHRDSRLRVLTAERSRARCRVLSIAISMRLYLMRVCHVFRMCRVFRGTWSRRLFCAILG